MLIEPIKQLVISVRNIYAVGDRYISSCRHHGDA